MSTSPLSTRRLSTATPEGPADQRLHPRFELALAGRFMRANKDEFTCTLKDISVGGLSLSTTGTTKLDMGEKIIAYVDRLGGLEGHVVRTWADGFAVKLSATQHKQEKLAAQITWLLNESDLKGAAARQHDRIPVGNRSLILTISEGVEVPCLVLDVSLSGASIACKAKPDIQSAVRIGRLRAKVTRHHVEGIGVQFFEILDAETMRAHFS
jgi:hypothetical protein